MAHNKIQTACPTCKKQDTWHADNTARPFCSARCKLIDLGEWADGGRAIVGDDMTSRIADDEDESENGN